MRAGRSARSASFTAEVVALIRDLSGADPYAHHFIGGGLRALGRVLRSVDPSGHRTDRLTLGLTDATRARHRWLDERLLEAAADGITQCVLLGAGFDARPWRFADPLRDCSIFLVDHPATAAARAGRGPRERNGVTRVDVDFATEDFTVALSEAGFDWRRPAVVIWEGVTMYLPRAAVVETLSRLADQAAKGTRVCFDAVTFRSADEQPRLERLSRWVLSRIREPVMDGLPVEEVRGFVERTGLTIRRCVPIRDAVGGERAWPDMILVEAEVTARP